jgi:hypothetical protein
MARRPKRGSGSRRTAVEQTPVSREKPYLFVDGKGSYNVRVASAQRGSRSVSSGTPSGRTIPLRDFFVAEPSDPVQKIDAAWPAA